MHHRSSLLITLTLLLLAACDADPLAVAQPAPELDTASDKTTAVEKQSLWIPPPGWPVLDNAYVTEPAEGHSRLKRRTVGATIDVEVKNQTPGHVQMAYSVIFNHPEFCREPDDRMPDPSPCSANGAADRRDGLIPEVRFSVDTWAHTVVGKNRKTMFRVDFGRDTPIERFSGGPGLVNPEGALIGIGVMDKGPLAPEGPLRTVQTSTLFGGCQGPPAFGPLPCKLVAVAQHHP